MKLFYRKRSSRIKPDDRLPLRLDHRRIYIFPSRHGLLFLGVLAAMLLGAVNYNNNLAFLLVFLLGGITLVGLLHTYRNLYGLGLESATADPVFAGQQAEFVFVADARGRPRQAIGWFFSGSRPVLENLAPGDETRIRLSLSAERRGRLKPDRLTVFSRYPLGLFNAWAVLKPDINCLIYPAPISGTLRLVADEEKHDDSGTTSQVASDRPGVDDFQGLKPYQPGHLIGHIAWKALSRGRGVYVKNFMAENRGDTVLLDYDVIRAQDPETKLSRLCDMVIRVSAMNLEYGIKLPDEIIAPGKGDRHREFCLKRLALFGLPENDQ